MSARRITLVEALDHGRSRTVVKQEGDVYGERVEFDDGSVITIDVEDGTYYSTLTGSDPDEIAITLIEAAR